MNNRYNPTSKSIRLSGICIRLAFESITKQVSSLMMLVILCLGNNSVIIANTPNTPEKACDLVNEASINLQGGSCDNMLRVCLTASLSDMAIYDITDNGIPYSGPLDACAYDTSFAYTYFSLPGGGNGGPYIVDSWTVNSTTFSGAIANMTALTDSMNIWDPTGNWTLDGSTSSVRGGNTANTYSNLIITDDVTKATVVLNLNIVVSPNDEGTAIMLLPGFHMIEVTDPVQACSDIVFINIFCTDCPNTYAGQKEFQVDDCSDLVDICTEIPWADTADYVIWDNGILIPSTQYGSCNVTSVFSYDYSTLAGQGSGGPFILQNWTVNGSSFLGFFLNMNALADSMDNWDPTGDWSNDAANLRIVGGDQSTTYSAITVQQQSNPSSEIISISTLNTPENVQFSLNSGQHELVIVNNAQSCSDTNYIVVNCGIQCPDILGAPLTLDGGDCEQDGTADFCINVPTDDLIFYQILDNDVVFSGNMNGCNPDTALYFSLSGLPNLDNPGLFSLDNWTINGQDFSATGLTSFGQLADLMSAWDVTADWEYSAQVLRGGDSANDYGDLQFNLGPNAPEVVSLSFNISSQSSTLELEAGLHNIILTNTNNGCADTVQLTVNCTDNCPALVADYPGRLSMPDCQSPSAWCIEVAPDLLANYSLRVNGNDYEDGITACNFRRTSISYDVSGIHQNGREPFQLTSWFVNGQQFSGSFLDIQSLVDSLNSWNPNGNWIFDTNLFTITSSNISNNYSGLNIVNSDNSSIFITLEEEQEATASSLELYAGQQQVVISSTVTGCQDTFAVLVDCISKEVVTDTVLVNVTDTICLATDQLIGNLVSMENICAASAGEFVIFEIQKDQFCVSYTGIEIGQDSACIRICDDLGLCDTTFLNIYTIAESKSAPVVVNDTITTMQGVSVENVDVTKNDSGFTLIDTLYIITAPANGIATVNSNNTINYTPNQDFCGSVADMFEYVLCTQYGCDTGSVNVIVYCDNVKAFTGFSPNGDQINETFVIEGIELMPDNRLSIFNRWGNQVYRKENYQNDNGWDGTFDGIDVPDGTYFYLLEDGNGKIYSGYVQLNR